MDLQLGYRYEGSYVFVVYTAWRRYDEGIQAAICLTFIFGISRISCGCGGGGYVPAGLLPRSAVFSYLHRGYGRF